jgi:quercetin dioxygenase-like cupin family protein
VPEADRAGASGTMTTRHISSKVGTTKLFEDDRVRVWVLDLEPGQATEWHEHDCDYVFVVTMPGCVETQYVDGATEAQIGDPVGQAQYRVRDKPHRLVNTGETHYQNIVIELKAASLTNRAYTDRSADV